MIDNSHVKFYVGEVVSYNDTYKSTSSIPQDTSSKKNKPFSINVRVKVNDNDKIFPDIIPSNINLKQIPIIGENVLIYQGYNENTSYIGREYQWYYLTTINVQSNTNNNITPIITAKFTPDSDFNDINIPPLQPYIGDILIEGRWGNTIRLGSTNSNSDKYYKQSPWKGDTVTDPIITLSTRKSVQPSDWYNIESLQSDDSSLYLTSTQNFPEFKLNNIIQTSTGESFFNGSQFIGTADRITLKSKSDIIVLDSNTAVEINTPLISIGQKPNSLKEYGLHTEQVKDLFDTIIDILNFGLVAGTTPVTINPALNSLFTTQLQTARKTIDNKLIKQDKS